MITAGNLCVTTWLNHEYNYCCFRVNTFSKKVKVGEDQYHAIHEYNDTLKNIYVDDFKTSMEFQSFCRRTGRTDVGYSKFKEGALSCKCIQQPQMRVCVDEIETGFTEMMTTLKNIHLKTKHRECPCPFCHNEAVKKETMGEGEHLLMLSIFHIYSQCVILLYFQNTFIPYRVQ